MGNEYHGKIQLASKGIFYEGELRDNEGWLNVEPWGSLEERILISPSIGFSETIDRLTKRCTDCPIDPGKLLLVDRWQLFIYMRCVSYGGEGFSFPFKCEGPGCGKKDKHEMDLEQDLNTKYVDDPDLLLELDATHPLEEPFTFVLPIQEKRIGWRMLRGEDERRVDKFVNKQMKSSRRRLPKGEDPSYIYRLALRIMFIDDNTDVSITEAIELVESLKGKDSLAFRQEITAVDFGVEDEVLATCTHCGWENELELPMDKTFFRPQRRIAKTA